MRISELAQRTGCHLETVRYYERIGLLPSPARSPSPTSSSSTGGGRVSYNGGGAPVGAQALAAAAGAPAAMAAAAEPQAMEAAPVVQQRHADANEPGRNDPCWCGSGKKYKRCHGA